MLKVVRVAAGLRSDVVLGVGKRYRSPSASIFDNCPTSQNMPRNMVKNRLGRLAVLGSVHREIGVEVFVTYT